MDKTIIRDLSGIEPKRIDPQIEKAILSNIKLRDLTYIEDSLYKRIKEYLLQYATDFFILDSYICTLVRCNNKAYIKQFRRVV